MLIGHMHKRGTLFTADLVDPDGTRTPLYRQTEYADPRAKLLTTPPLLINAGQKIAYECTHDNATHPRLGCEEQPGVAPGRRCLESIGQNGSSRTLRAPRSCAPPKDRTRTSAPRPTPPIPGRTFTGNCVQANLVFGFTSEDDMCILPGYYYDADLRRRRARSARCSLGQRPVPLFHGSRALVTSPR